MARQKVIVKHLEAIENLGSMDVLCSDKTGTLTSGDMVLDQHLDPFGQVSERPVALAQVNSVHQTGITSPLDKAILKRGGVAGNGYRKIDEIPFDFERRRLSIVVESSGERLLSRRGLRSPSSRAARPTSKTGTRPPSTRRRGRGPKRRTRAGAGLDRRTGEAAPHHR